MLVRGALGRRVLGRDVAVSGVGVRASGMDVVVGRFVVGVAGGSVLAA